MRDLKEIKYIIEIKKNLIYLGVMELSRFKFTLKNDRLKVSLENLVVMKGIRQKNLYFLQSSTVTVNMTMATKVIGRTPSDFGT